MPKTTKSVKAKGKPKPKITEKNEKVVAPTPKISKATSIFKSWAPQDFYGPKASHIFYYGRVDSTNVQEFRLQLHEASTNIKTDEGVNSKPKPIVIHIHSPGGDGDLGITLSNFLREVPVPVAVVVDGYACSAITPLVVSAAYRVMHDFSFVMFHEGSLNINNYVKDSEAEFYVNELVRGLTYEYKRVYELNSSIPNDVLEDMLTRDIFMSSDVCLKYNVVDRVISLDKKSCMERWSEYIKTYPDINLTSNPLTWKINMNHL